MSESDGGLAWKIAGGVVLGLLLFNTFERYQQSACDHQQDRPATRPGDS